jgi:hypothetical protein
MDADGALLLLRSILVDLPPLPGASCVGQHAVFDPVLGNGHGYRDQERARLTKAARVCAGCPVIQRRTTVTVATTVEVIASARRPAPPPGVLAFAK